MHNFAKFAICIPWLVFRCFRKKYFLLFIAFQESEDEEKRRGKRHAQQGGGPPIERYSSSPQLLRRRSGGGGGGGGERSSDEFERRFLRVLDRVHETLERNEARDLELEGKEAAREEWKKIAQVMFCQNAKFHVFTARLNKVAVRSIFSINKFACIYL